LPIGMGWGLHAFDGVGVRDMVTETGGIAIYINKIRLYWQIKAAYHQIVSVRCLYAVGHEDAEWLLYFY